jgi:hypothetical protein
MTQQQHGYRDAEMRPYCAVCGKVAKGACIRCGRPVCEEHVHAEDKRCERCEDEWTTRQRGYAVAVAVTCVLGVPAFWFLVLPFFGFVFLLVNGFEKETAKIL